MELRDGADRDGVQRPLGQLDQDPGYGFVLRSYDTKKSWYEGYFLTLDKPYTSESKWGFDLAYTYADARQQASYDQGVAFAFDSLPPDFATFKNIYTEKQKLVMSGTVGLPAGFRISSIITLTSGLPFYLTDCTPGWDKCFGTSMTPETQSFLGVSAVGIPKRGPARRVGHQRERGRSRWPDR